MPTPNVDLLTKTLAHIKANPEEWDQDVYRKESSACGTAMCFAGWSATLAGGQWSDPDGDYLRATEDDYPSYVHDGVIHVAYRARRLLGITPKQSEELFHPRNTLWDLECLVGELCAQAGGSEATPQAAAVDHIEPKEIDR